MSGTLMVRFTSQVATCLVLPALSGHLSIWLGKCRPKIPCVDGVKESDLICVSGVLGEAAAGLHQLSRDAS